MDDVTEVVIDKEVGHCGGRNGREGVGSLLVFDGWMMGGTKEN